MHRTFNVWTLILCSFSSVHVICMFSSHLTIKSVHGNVICTCGLLSCLEQMHQGSSVLQHSASTNCTATHFAEVLQIIIVCSAENIYFSSTHACACTNLPESFSHTCMHVHSPNKKHFSHTHACMCVCVRMHTLFVLPHVCISGCHRGLLITLLCDIDVDSYIYIYIYIYIYCVGYIKLEWL
jgi:hypothetical protein